MDEYAFTKMLRATNPLLMWTNMMNDDVYLDLFEILHARLFWGADPTNKGTNYSMNMMNCCIFCVVSVCIGKKSLIARGVALNNQIEAFDGCQET